MAHVLTLIAAPPPAALPAEEAIAALRRELAEAGGQPGPIHWLGRDQACDIEIAEQVAAIAEHIARARLRGTSVDVTVQRAENRRKRLLLADMESTIVIQELLDEVGRFVGIGEHIAEVTARAMRGEIDFAQSLRERVALLKGRSATVLEQVAAGIALTSGARSLVQTMRANGAYAVLLSGGFDYFASQVQNTCGFHEAWANRLLVANGRITGEVQRPIFDGAGKLRVTREAAARLSVPLDQAAAVGDGANDVPMLQAVGLGVAFRGKPAVVAATRFHLEHADLTGLLYLQGYRRDEFRE
jgi:phosphoserine phosphatase